MYRIAAAWILAILATGAPANAAPFFDESFEYENSQALIDSPWVNFPCTAAELDGIMGISSDRYFSGTKSLKYTYIGPNPPKTCWMDRFYPAKTEIWTREWLFLDTFLPESPGTKHIFNGGSVEPAPGDGGYPNSWTGFSFASKTLGVGWQGTGAISSDQAIFAGDIPSGRWTCIEVHYKMNTPDVADGIVEVWVDGEQRINNKSFLMRRSSVTINDNVHNTSAGDFSMTRLYRQHGTGVMYLDDYAVGDAPIGCQGQTPIDTTPPAAPSGMVVQ